jgi:hypothetical protein
MCLVSYRSIAFQKHPPERNHGQQGQIHMLSLNTQRITLSYEMRRCVVCWMFTDVSEERTTFIFRIWETARQLPVSCWVLSLLLVYPEIEAMHSAEISTNLYRTRRYVSRDSSLRSHCCEDVSSSKCTMACHSLVFLAFLNLFVWQSSKHGDTQSVTQHY